MRAVWLKTRCLMTAAHSMCGRKAAQRGYSGSSQGALVATTRATRVIGTRADGVAFSIEQGAANNILLANGGVLTVESDTSSDKTQVNTGGRGDRQNKSHCDRHDAHWR